MKKRFISTAAVLVALVGMCTVSCGVSSGANNLLGIGSEALLNGKYGEAIDAYKNCLQQDNENADAYYGLAQAYFAEESFEQAAEAAEEGFSRTSDPRLKDYIVFLEEESEKRRFKELEAIGLPYFVKEAICAYNDLTDHKDITQEMMDEVVSLQIRLLTYNTTAEYDDESEWSDIPYDETQYTYYAEASVNGSDYWFIYPYVGDERYEMIYGMIDSEFERKRYFDGMFIPKNPEDAAITQKERSEILSAFPFLADRGAGYICDVDAKTRELRKMQSILCHYVLADAKKEMAVSKRIDLSALELLPNLQSVEYHISSVRVEGFADLEEYKAYMGFEFINSPVPVTEVLTESKW